MSVLSSLITKIKAVIYPNTNNEIDAQKHQNLEVEIVETIFGQIDAMGNAYLGTILATDIAPTPGKSGFYKFSTGGVVSWLQDTPTVSPGDQLSVVFSDPNYTYSWIDGALNISDSIESQNSSVAASSKAVYDLNQSKISKSGDENIEGVKTFAASPIIPTPTTDYQATTKEYVDASDEVLRSDLNELEQEQIQGGVYDVSSHNDGAVFESLSALLGSANLSTLIPTSVRHGGMSIRFIQGSDNKYVQWRLVADEWSINTKDWAIADEGVYSENPEFVYVKTDKDDNILWAIKTDGSIYYGAGVPKQVVDYINNRIAELSLDEYEDIVSFLSDYLGSDTTLKVMIDSINAQIDTKLDAEGLDADALGTMQAVDNPEWLSVTTDSEGRILRGRKTDGTVVENMPQENPSSVISHIDNPEWIDVKTDKNGNILKGIKKDGTSVDYTIKDNNGFDYFLEDTYKVLMASMIRTEILGSTGGVNGTYRNLVLAAITDTHNDNKVIYNFIEFYKRYGIYVNDMVHFGDLISNEFPNPYDHRSVNGYNKILLCLGNHDAYSQNHHGFDDVVSSQDCYERYFKGSIEDWNVNYTQNLCYYFKDYTYYNSNGTLCGVRYIVLDCMHWGETQKEWLESILYNGENSALSLNYPVIIAQHVPCAGAAVVSDYTEGMNFFECTFNSKDNLSIYHTYNYDSLGIVDTFQNQGGEFITWLFGHWHVDGIGKYINYPNQMFIIQAMGGRGSDVGSWSDTNRVNNTYSENQFNILSFDTFKKYIRILRVGAEYNRNLQHKKTLTISYDNGFEIISNF